jgi:hypothetical protein
VRERVSSEFEHTPRLLYNQANPGLLDNPLFGNQTAPQAPPVGSPQSVGSAAPDSEGVLRLMLEGFEGDLIRTIAGIDPGIIVKGNSQSKSFAVEENEYDLLIVSGPQGFRVYLRTGFPLQLAPISGGAELITFIKRQLAARRLAALTYPRQRFNVFFDLTGPNGVLIGGDKIGFRIRPERDSYLLLVDIDPAGRVYVIYPGDESEIVMSPGGRELVFHEMGEVAPPHFGAEHLKLFAFSKKPHGLEELAGTEFWPHDSRFTKLMRMLKGNPHASQATLRVKTAPKALFNGMQ